MENFKKIETIIPNTKEINDDVLNMCICVFLNVEKPFEIDERNEIADMVEKKFSNHIFTGKNDFISNDHGVIEYKFYYEK